MPKALPHWTLTCLLLVGSAGAAETAPSLTLEQALSAVEKVNVSVLLSQETVVQANQAIGQQRATVMPLIDASATQRRSQGVSIATVVVTSGRPASRFDALISGSYAILNPARLSTLKSVKAAAEVAQANYQVVVQNVLTDVGTTYFTHLRNLRTLDVLDANITRARALLELAANQLKAGVATQIDVTRAEAQLFTVEQARMQHLTTLYRSELFLKRLLDLDTGRELTLADFRVKRIEPGLFTFSDQKTAFENRADYLSAQRALTQTQIDVTTTTYERLPNLTLTGNYGVATAKVYDPDFQEQWGTGIGVSVPVFDGMRTSANRRIALSRQRAQEARLHNLELQISAELRLALQAAGSRNAQITVAEKGLSLAQEELRLARQRYQQGVADNREVLDAQNRLAFAEDNLVDAVFLYNLSRLELARARGDVRGILAEKNPSGP
jgi:outer membrane protein TolC